MDNQTDKLHISSDNLFRLLIEPTGFCNAKCPHCPRYTDDGFLHEYISEKHLTVEAFKNGLDPLKLQKLRRVEFAGATGDPAMSPHIEDLISFFDFVPLVTIDTNGSLRNTKWWKELARFSNLQVVWSIDGLHDTNHLYRIGTDYKKIMENSAAFISAGGNAVWKCLIFKHNEHQIDEITQQAKSQGFSKVFFNRAYDYRFQNQSSWPVFVEGKFMHNIEPSTLSQETIKSKEVNFVQPKLIAKSKKSLTDVLCPWAQDNSAYINVLGQLMPCCMMTHETTNDYIGKTIFQDMVGGDFNNISLYHYDMDYIFENYFGKEFNETLKNKDTMHPVCAKTCSGIINGLSTIPKGHRQSTIKAIKIQ
jgi:MoaA/NifB/PqqE/SkfB family radical SAM enzyme